MQNGVAKHATHRIFFRNPMTPRADDHTKLHLVIHQEARARVQDGRTRPNHAIVELCKKTRVVQKPCIRVLVDVALVIQPAKQHFAGFGNGRKQL